MVWTIPNLLTVLRLLAAPAVALAFVAFARPLADWVALGLFVTVAATDWIDGYLARRWQQVSRFGAMLDPVADKALVIIALAVVMALSRLDPWVVVPAALILFREVLVSGLREYLGAAAGKLKVTPLARWKTTLQMIAIALLLLGLALQEVHYWLYRAMDPAEYAAALETGTQDWNATWRVVRGSWVAGIAGLVLIWLAAALTAVTGWDYFRKALPLLGEAGR